MIVLNAKMQWMELYTKQQVLNCLKSVRRRVLDLFASSLDDLNGGPIFRFTRPHARRLSDWRGPHHGGLQSPSVSPPTQRPNAAEI